MKNLIALFLIVLTSTGCIIEADKFEMERTRDVDISCKQWMPHQAEAMLLIRDMFEWYTGEDLYEAEPIVYWTDTICPYPSPADGLFKTAVISRNQCFNGLTISCHELYVADRGLMSSSAFAHEIAHCYKIFLGENPDGAHLDAKWWGVVGEIDAQLRELEW